ncbi:MAG: 23S rRNA (pseudouridine(1915)-N(3))-methyltransferase RlmH [Acidiphilium sp.]
MTQSGARHRIIAIGRDAKSPEAALVQRYLTRMQPGLDLLPLPAGSGSSVEIKRREGEAILKRIASDDFIIVLDQGGVMPDSAGLAALLAGWRVAARPLAFIIGGAEGLDRTVVDCADTLLSLGRLTLPHMLARAILAEQLYRAQCILANHPYHRAGRP